MMDEKSSSGGLALSRMVGGTKVSQIARTFQSLAPSSALKDPLTGSNGDIHGCGVGVRGKRDRDQSTSPKPERRESNGNSGGPLKEPKSLAESPTIVTVVRTESHVARFNNARALFEKLGEENRSKGADRSKTTKQDVRSRSSSTNSSLGDDPPTRAAHKTASCSSIPSMINSRSPSPLANNQSNNSNGMLNGFETQMNGNHETNEQNGKHFPEESAPTPIHYSQQFSNRMPPFVNGLGEKPAKPDKPERKLNSRELIEKQRNWTSHFSKNRNSTSRSNSDPSKADLKSIPSYKTSENSAATRSSSFTSPRLRSPPPSSPPPPPPTITKTSPVKSPRTSITSPKTPSSCLPKPVEEDQCEQIEKPKEVSCPPVENHSSSEVISEDVSLSTSNKEDSPRHNINVENDKQEEEESVPGPVVDYTQTLKRSKKMVSSVHVTLGSPQFPVLVNSPTQGDISTINSLDKEEESGTDLEKEDDQTEQFAVLNSSSASAPEDKTNSVLISEINDVQTNKIAPTSDVESKNKTNSFNVNENLATNLDSTISSTELISLTEQFINQEQVCESENVINKPNVQFNIGSDLSSDLLKSTTTMCSSSVSEEDSGFVSSEAANLGTSFILDSDAKELDSGFLNINDSKLQFLDDDVSSTSSDNPQQKYEHDDIVEGLAETVEEEVPKPSESPDKNRSATLDTSLMTPDEADNLLSTRIISKRGVLEGLLSDEEAQEVVRLLSPTPDKSEILQEKMVCSSAAEDLPSSNLVGSVSNIEDSIVSSHLGSEYGSDSNLLDMNSSRISSVNSLDELELTRSSQGLDQKEPEIDPYEGFVPEACKEVFEENGVHYYEDGHFWMEVPGLPSADSQYDDDSVPIKASSKVCFSTGPIKVYSTFSMSEYDRRNEDVDPVAASAEYELEKRVEKLELMSVELEKGASGLGLIIIGMGVGADAGLEKLGIFVKMLTEQGAAAKDGRIQVSDQIIEVDGKSLVGVTQAYAASVLRNTCGKVKFIIGREKDPENSEVAQLIRQSLQADKEREEHKQRLERGRNPQYNGDHSNSILSDSLNQMPIGSSAQQLQELLQDSQLRASLAEKEVAKLKLEELEGSNASKEEFAEKLRQSSMKLCEVERNLYAAKKDAASYQGMLEQSQAQYQAIEKKYTKAKRLLKEFQQRESDLIHREEFYLQLLQEKDTEYNALVKALKDRVIQVEQELLETQRKTGLPIRLPYDTNNLRLSIPQITTRPPVVPIRPLLEQLGAELSESEDGPEEEGKTATVERKVPVKEELDRAVPQHELLDSTANKNKAELATRGGLANRHLPSSTKKNGSLSNSSSDYGLDDSFDYSDDNSDINEKRNTVFSDYSNENSMVKSPSASSIHQYSAIIKSTHQSSSYLQHQSSPDPWVPRSTNERRVGPPTSLAEQLKQVLAERERRLSNSSEYSRDYSEYTTNTISSALAEDIRQAVNEANARINKNVPLPHQLHWQHVQSSPSSVSSSGSVSTDMSPSRPVSDSSNEWLDSSTNKKSHMWQSQPIPEWSKEQVCQWLMALNLEQYIPKFREQQLTGMSLLTLESKDFKNLGIVGDDKNKLKRKLKELKVQVEKEKRHIEKEKKEKERLQKKAEKLAEKANKRK